MRPTLEQLAGDPHDSAQWLLYQGLIAGESVYADWAAELLLQGRHRFLAGYASDSVWVARQVLQAISSRISDGLFSQLEAAVRDVRFEWERRHPGRYAFSLLSALDERRLSEIGKRRLGELRRAAGTEQPPEPKGIVFGSVVSPISNDAAPHMNDDNWLQAMSKHAREREALWTFRGGARELSRVLQEQVKEDPYRFASLALRLTADVNPAYTEAILMGLGEAQPVDDEAVIYRAVRHIVSLGHSDTDRWLGMALRSYVRTAPVDIVALIKDRLVATADSIDDVAGSADASFGPQVGDPLTRGINTVRGSLAEALGDLLIYDVDGARTALVAPVLGQLAADPSNPVRTCVAHLIGAAMRHARPVATEAFWQLIETDDALLATGRVVRILCLLGNEDPSAVRSVVERMLASEYVEVREAAGQLAAFAAMEWGVGDYLETVLAGTDAAVRKGVADLAAHNLTYAVHTGVAAATLTALLNDPEDDVRKAAAEVASTLRGHALRPYTSLVRTLLGSRAFVDATPQLLYTLEQAPDRVDSLALLCAERFVEILGPDSADIRTAAAGDAREVGRLTIRGLAQSRTPTQRAAFLDVLDKLLLAGAYGIDDMVNVSER